MVVVGANQHFGLSCMSFQHEYLPTLERQRFFFFFFRTLRLSSIGLHIHSHSPVTLLYTRFQQRAPNKVADEAHSRHHQVVCMCNKHQNCLVVFSSHTGIGVGQF